MDREGPSPASLYNPNSAPVRGVEAEGRYLLDAPVGIV